MKFKNKKKFRYSIPGYRGSYISLCLSEISRKQEKTILFINSNILIILVYVDIINNRTQEIRLNVRSKFTNYFTQHSRSKG
jgi:hypothetical protein